jgi:hypothetical protein
MTQLEFDFLGMPKYQLDLGMDYTQPQINWHGISIANGGTGGGYALSLSAGQFSSEPVYKFDLDKIPLTVKQEKMPWYRRTFYKLLGIKTE